MQVYNSSILSYAFEGLYKFIKKKIFVTFNPKKKTKRNF